MPSFADIDPIEIPRVLPYIWICDYDSERDTFRYRLSGEAINTFYGFNLKHRTLAEVVPVARFAKVQARYLRVVRLPAAVHNAGLVYADQGRSYQGERLILPLGRDGLHADGLIGVTYWNWGQGVLDLPRESAQVYKEWMASLAPVPERA